MENNKCQHTVCHTVLVLMLEGNWLGNDFIFSSEFYNGCLIPVQQFSLVWNLQYKKKKKKRKLALSLMLCFKNLVVDFRYIRFDWIEHFRTSHLLIFFFFNKKKQRNKLHSLGLIKGTCGSLPDWSLLLLLYLTRHFSVDHWCQKCHFPDTVMSIWHCFCTTPHVERNIQ